MLFWGTHCRRQREYPVVSKYIIIDINAVFFTRPGTGTELQYRAVHRNETIQILSLSLFLSFCHSHSVSLVPNEIATMRKRSADVMDRDRGRYNNSDGHCELLSYIIIILPLSGQQCTMYAGRLPPNGKLTHAPPGPLCAHVRTTFPLFRSV